MSRSDIVTLAQVLHVLLRADEKLTREEQDFFDKLQDQLEFTDEERAQAQSLMSLKEAEAAARSLPYGLRQGQVEALIEGALVDADLDGREREFVERIARVLHLDDETVHLLWEKLARQLGFGGTVP